jgi:nicotinate phosphoribosyltransferase
MGLGMDSKIFNHTIYNQSLALLTDLYQLTMVYGYWKSGCAELETVFHLNFRRAPFQGGFAIAAGLQTAIEFIRAFRFSKTDLEYLAGLSDPDGKPLFEPEFLQFLSTFTCSCDIDAMPEGSVVFPFEPMIRIKGPLWQAQLLESPLLNIINFQTLIATKAARMCLAAAPDPVIEFGMRRAQGIDGAISASRAAFIGGCIATSDVLAGKLFGIPVRGTHGHSWVMAFESEMEAFSRFAKVMPKGCVILVDTYNSIEGVKKAIQVANELKPTGFTLEGVRIDSGDLAALSIEIRKILDLEGFSSTQIMASSELDEYLIRDLKQQGAKITVWGVGTHLVTGKGQSALDGIYKLSAIQDREKKWHYKLKLSETTSKVTNPGILHVRRWFDGKFYCGDVIYDEFIGHGIPCVATGIVDPDRDVTMHKGSAQDVLVPIFRRGECVYKSPFLLQIQSVTKLELSRLPDSVKRFVNPQLYFVGLEKKLHEKKLELIRAFQEG